MNPQPKTVSFDYLKRKSAGTVTLEKSTEHHQYILTLTNYDPETGEKLPDTKATINAPALAQEASALANKLESLKAILEDAYELENPSND